MYTRKNMSSSIYNIDEQAVAARQCLFHNVLRTGDVMVVSRSTYLGKIETILAEAQKYDLHIADVPANCYSILPVIPLSEVELSAVCREYCLASSEGARASIRSALYMREYPLFHNNIYNRVALYHPSDPVIRILHLCYTVCKATIQEQEIIFQQSPYLNSSPVREICRSFIGAIELAPIHASPQSFSQHNDLFHADTQNNQGQYPAESSTQSQSNLNQSTLLDVRTTDDLSPQHSTVSSALDRHATLHTAPEQIHYDDISDKEDVETIEQDDLTGVEVVDEVSTVDCEYPDEKDYEVVCHSSVHHDNSDGEKRLAAIYLRQAIHPELCRRATHALEKAATRKNMRSRTNGGEPPETGIVGYYDYLNHPTPFKFRETAYMRQHRDLVKDGCAGFLRALDALYRREAPQHYRLQKAAIPPQFQLFDTVFSTITVNRNFRTAMHTDRGDFRSGLGALIVVNGKFKGCHLAIKRLRKAFELRVGDVLLFDTFLEHGNTPIHAWDEDCARVSLVCYFRTGLISWMYAMERHKHINLLTHERLSAVGQSQRRAHHIRGLSSNTTKQHHCTVNNGDKRTNISSDNSNDDHHNNGNNNDNHRNGVASNCLPSTGLSIPPQLARELTMVQLTALRFSIERTVHECGCVIAMTMGLGKTLVALTLSYLYSQAYPDRDILIVTPKPIMMHWSDEHAKWKAYGLHFRHFIVGGAVVSDFRSVNHLGNGVYNNYASGSMDDAGTREGRVFVVNPECIPSFRRNHRHFDPILVIVDEGHRMASKTSQLTCHLNTLRCRRRVVLSGTPIQNDADELYNLVSWVNESVPHVLSFSKFSRLMSDVQTYINGEETGSDGSGGGSFCRAMSSLAYIHDWMNGFVFREMACELPPLHDYLLICGSSSTQHSIFHNHLSATPTTASCAGTESMLASDSNKCLSASEHWPSHLSTHPLCYLAFVSGSYGSMTGSHSQRDSISFIKSVHKSTPRRCLTENELGLVESCYMDINNGNLSGFLSLSGKLTVLIHIMKMISASEEKAIIFSQYVGAQDMIHRTLTAFDVSAFTVRGRDALSRRQFALDQFRRSKDLRALVLSTKLAAYGLDFTVANHVILFDSWWNPQVDAQAIARAYRCNQTKPVWVYRLGTSFEDQRIFKAQNRKMALFNCVMHGKPSRVAHAGEVVDCTASEDNDRCYTLWNDLKKIYLTGGDQALINVYRYRDTVKEKA